MPCDTSVAGLLREPGTAGGCCSWHWLKALLNQDASSLESPVHDAATRLQQARCENSWFWRCRDILLLEVGWAALWLAPRSPAGAAKEPARVAVVLQRWVLFKLMFCSGAVKIQVLPSCRGGMSHDLLFRPSVSQSCPRQSCQILNLPASALDRGHVCSICASASFFYVLSHV